MAKFIKYNVIEQTLTTTSKRNDPYFDEMEVILSTEDWVKMWNEFCRVTERKNQIFLTSEFNNVVQKYAGDLTVLQITDFNIADTYFTVTQDGIFISFNTFIDIKKAKIDYVEFGEWIYENWKHGNI